MESVMEYPFAAIAGMDAAKEALLLLAIEPRLNGVLIAGPAGIGKSVLARSLKTLGAPSGACCFVESPLHVTNESLLGSLDLENTIKRGVRVFSMGLLTRADRGFLFIDHVNRVDLSTAAQVAQALDQGWIVIERDGVSHRYLCRFRLAATFAPDDGDVCSPIRDTAAIHVFEDGCLSAADRLTMLRRVEAFHRDREAFTKSYAQATSKLAQRIEAARDRLSYIKPAPADLRFVSSTALQLGVEGHRAECFCWWFIRARAALMQRTKITSDDLDAAVRFVLEPRSRARPAEQPGRNQTMGRAPSPAADSPGNGSRTGGSGAVRGNRPAGTAAQAIHPTLDCPPPPGALVHPGPRDGWPAGRGALPRGRSLNTDRGRYVSAVAGPVPGGKVAFDATLRAAAPFQLLRRQRHPDAGAGGVSIVPGDLRYKQFRRRSGILIVFALDASGSMAMNRISLAKGALLRLLREAYLHRDKVSLVAFQGLRSETLLPPSSSVDRARRAVEDIKVGDGTPLAAGLNAAINVARLERNTGSRSVLLVLFTDGGANVPLVPGNDVWSEIEAVAGAVRREGAASVVIDTTARYHTTGRAERLAALLGGRFLSLPSADRHVLQEALADLAAGLREGP